MGAFIGHGLVSSLCCVVPLLHSGASSTASKCLSPRTHRACLPLLCVGLWAAYVGANWSSTGTTMATPSWAWYTAPDTPLCCWPSGERVWVGEKGLGSGLGLEQGPWFYFDPGCPIPLCVSSSGGHLSCALSLSLTVTRYQLHARCQARPACLPFVSVTPAMVHCTS